MEPIRIKTLDEIVRDYPDFDRDERYPALKYVPQMGDLLGATVWETDQLPNNRFYIYGFPWVKAMLVFSEPTKITTPFPFKVEEHNEMVKIKFGKYNLVLWSDENE